MVSRLSNEGADLSFSRGPMTSLTIILLYVAEWSDVTVTMMLRIVQYLQTLK